MMKAKKIINRMWVRSRAGTFPNDNGRSSDGCGTGAGDDCGIRDESTRGPVGGLGRQV